jgi:hypothetical protein
MHNLKVTWSFGEMDIDLSLAGFETKITEEFVKAGFKSHNARSGFSFSYNGKYCRFEVKYSWLSDFYIEGKLKHILYPSSYAPKEYIFLKDNILTIHADKIKEHIDANIAKKSQLSRDKNALTFKYNMLKIFLQDALDGLKYTINIRNKGFEILFELSDNYIKSIPSHVPFHLENYANYSELCDTEYDDYRFKFAAKSYSIKDIKPKILQLIDAHKVACEHITDLEKSINWIQSEIDEFVHVRKLEIINLNNKIQEQQKIFYAHRN